MTWTDRDKLYSGPPKREYLSTANRKRPNSRPFNLFADNKSGFSPLDTRQGATNPVGRRFSLLRRKPCLVGKIARSNLEQAMRAQP
jgi:hypothetical protein